MLKLLIIFLRRPKSFILRVETIDGSANEGEDYIAVNEILTFEPYETEKEVGDTLTFSLFPFLSSDRCDNCGRQPVGARRGVLPQVDDAAGLGVSGIDLSPFRHHFATILSKFCHHCQLLSLAIVLVNMVCRATETERSSWAGPASWRSRSSTMMVCSSP